MGTYPVSYKSNRNIVYSCKYHIVFCPKYRHKILVGKISERLKSIIIHFVEECNAELIETEVMPDHVHIVCEVDPQFGVHKFVWQLKGRSSRILRLELGALWAFKEKTTYSLDKQLFRQYCRRCTVRSY